MGVAMGGLNPNGFPKPQMAPQPGMGIMAMMASTVPQPAALGGVLPALPGGAPMPDTNGASHANTSNLPLMTGASTLLSPIGESAGQRRKSSSSPSVSLINVAKVSPKLSRNLEQPPPSNAEQCWRRDYCDTTKLSCSYLLKIVCQCDMWMRWKWFSFTRLLCEDSCAWSMSCWNLWNTLLLLLKDFPSFTFIFDHYCKNRYVRESALEQ